VDDAIRWCVCSRLAAFDNPVVIPARKLLLESFLSQDPTQTENAETIALALYALMAAYNNGRPKLILPDFAPPRNASKCHRKSTASLVQGYGGAIEFDSSGLQI
jgi:hypothetical protein